MTTNAPMPPRTTNRLARESSPYLLQHAHNPVDWWPWGSAAIAEARRRDVPIFLSIGYSTCYWCHVMERESFENDDTARVVNDACVCIKLDREERPDLDEIYMAATVLTTGSGGWPMSLFLEPDTLRPFFCGTYFPNRPGLGRPAFTDVVRGMADAFRTRRDQVRAHALEIAHAVAEHLGAPSDARQQPAMLGAAQVADAAQRLLAMHDRVQGGFGQAPKFPQPVFLEFLLDARLRAADDSTADAIDAALHRTLDAMALGGINDHLAGGFHRYSVDAHWTVPHFEKMLYDQAQLAVVYARASQLLADATYADVARATLDHVLRDMTIPGPNATRGLASALDAEVDGREGLNYLWSRAQLDAALSAPFTAEDAALAADIFGVSNGPNFHDPHHRDQPPSNVLRLAQRLDAIAHARGIAPADLNDRVVAIKAALLRVRDARTQPRRDDKAIAAWNGMALSALARVGTDLAEPRFIDAAKALFDFIQAALVQPDGRLIRSWREGVPGPRAVLEDYAAVAQGCLDLARAGHMPALARALDLLRVAREVFIDVGTGVVHDTPDHEPDLFVRARATHDGAVPSASSMLLHALLDAHEATGDDAHLSLATKALASMAQAVAASPVGCVNSTRALLRILTNPRAATFDDPAATLALARDAAAQVAAQASAHPDALQPGDADPVSIFAGVERIALARDEPAELTILVNIAQGFHVPAADPAAKNLTPFRVHLVGGTGIAVYADYPPGEWYPTEPASSHAAHPSADPAASSDTRMRAYSGSFELRVALEREGEWTGRPLLAASFQPCRDDACLRATTVELDIALDQA